jgi:hypothetical protein
MRTQAHPRRRRVKRARNPVAAQTVRPVVARPAARGSGYRFEGDPLAHRDKGHGEFLSLVMPARAGILPAVGWMPAFAGMTGVFVASLISVVNQRRIRGSSDIF